MTKIDMDNLFYARINIDDNGIETYDIPKLLAKNVEGYFSIEFNESILFADNDTSYIIKEFKLGTISLRICDIGITAAQELTGAVINNGRILVPSVEKESAPVAIGFHIQEPNYRYRYLWFYKVNFKLLKTALQLYEDINKATIIGIIVRRNKVDKMGKYPWKVEATQGDPNISENIIQNWYTEVHEPIYR